MIELILFIALIFIIFGVIAFFINLIKKHSFSDTIFQNAYYKKQYLITKAEHQFFNILQEIVRDKYYVFPQIHLASLLEVKNSEKNWRSYFNKIIRKSVDFVICDKQYLKPLLVIELDDLTHYRYKRQDRDQFVNQALESVGLKCLHIRTSYSYNLEELKSQVLQGLL